MPKPDPATIHDNLLALKQLTQDTFTFLDKKIIEIDNREHKCAEHIPLERINFELAEISALVNRELNAPNVEHTNKLMPLVAMNMKLSYHVLTHHADHIPSNIKDYVKKSLREMGNTFSALSSTITFNEEGFSKGIEDPIIAQDPRSGVIKVVRKNQEVIEENQQSYARNTDCVFQEYLDTPLVSAYKEKVSEEGIRLHHSHMTAEQIAEENVQLEQQQSAQRAAVEQEIKDRLNQLLNHQSSQSPNSSEEASSIDALQLGSGVHMAFAPPRGLLSALLAQAEQLSAPNTPEQNETSPPEEPSKIKPQ